jgi:hypothetical protein
MTLKELVLELKIDILHDFFKVRMFNNTVVNTVCGQSNTCGAVLITFSCVYLRVVDGELSTIHDLVPIKSFLP